MNIKSILFLVIYLFTQIKITAQASEKANFEAIMKNKFSDNKSNRLVEITKLFLTKPYVGGTLEKPGDESLVVNLSQFDCSTLVETAIALTLTENKSFDNFKKQLTKLRYRNGKIENYGSRLHYLTDWLAENQKNECISLETKNLGGTSYITNTNFMSTHWPLYPSANTEIIKQTILESETNLKKNNFYYITKANLAEKQKQIKSGDIIAITTNKKGLDCSHQGIAIWQAGKLYLLHASSAKKQVIISQEPLIDYLAKNKAQTGVMVARLK
jgi:hypothetical protein